MGGSCLEQVVEYFYYVSLKFWENRWQFLVYWMQTFAGTNSGHGGADTNVRPGSQPQVRLGISGKVDRTQPKQQKYKDQFDLFSMYCVFFICTYNADVYSPISAVES